MLQAVINRTARRAAFAGIIVRAAVVLLVIAVWLVAAGVIAVLFIFLPLVFAAVIAAAFVLIAAGALLFAPRRTEGRLTTAAVLGGLAAFSVMFVLCLGYFMV